MPTAKKNPLAVWSVSTAGEALIDMVCQQDGSYLPCLGGGGLQPDTRVGASGHPHALPESAVLRQDGASAGAGPNRRWRTSGPT